MIFARRIASLIATTLLLVILLKISSNSRSHSYRTRPQGTGFDDGNLVDYQKNGFQLAKPIPVNQFSGENLVKQDDSTIGSASDVFPAGNVKPAGSSYSRGLVIGKLTTENTTWLQDYLLTDPGLVPYLYTVDNSTAPLHTPVNKGHEAMVYLTFILEHYDSLPDVTVFMHPHQRAWHTPELLNHDATEVLKRLSSERVTREGYMNLRCHWDPGCPERLPPDTGSQDDRKREKIAIVDAWTEMFPGEAIPGALAAPCCAQFAVARHRIRHIPKSSFERYRNWLLRTKENDWVSGRVFEYFWQKIFTDQAKLCPDARACYCDGYGICFNTAELYEEWFDNHHYWRKATNELEKWEQQASLIANIGDWEKIEKMKLDIPIPGRNLELEKEIDRRFQFLVERRSEALVNGTDPATRAKVAGRPWRSGDGY